MSISLASGRVPEGSSQVGAAGGMEFEGPAAVYLRARPAVQCGVQVLKEVQAANRTPHDDMSRDIMFGKTQFQRR